MAKNFLHIGVFRSGKLVDEHYAPEKPRDTPSWWARVMNGISHRVPQEEAAPERKSVSAGRSAGNNIWLPGSTLPESQVLFTFHRRNPVIHVTPTMEGEVALDGKVKQPLQALKASGQAEANGWSMELPDTARGWIGLGDTTFFLQVAQKPAPPPKNTLPPSARTGFMSGLAGTFGTIFLICGVVEGSALTWIAMQPEVEIEPKVEAAERVAEFIQPEKEEPPPAEEKPEDTKPDEKPAEEKPKEKPSPEKAAAAHADAVKKAVANNKLIQVLGSLSSADGALKDVFSQGKAFGSDVASALDGVSGVKIADGNDGPEHKGGTGGDGTVGVGDLGAAAGSGGNGKATLGERHVAAPQISFDKDDIDVPSGPVSKDDVTKYVRNRVKAIQGCYERELKLNPTLKGKIVVSFTITASGSVSECNVAEDSLKSEAVSSCITRLIRSWKFNFKIDDDVTVSFPFVFQPGG